MESGEGAAAGGAPVFQVVVATVAVSGVLAALIAVGLARRAGWRMPLLEWGENLASRAQGGLPGWSALPVAIATGALLSAIFGLQWDVAYHLDNGRDDGPLANPSHYFILLGLLGIFAAGWLAVALPRKGERPGPSAVRLSSTWHAPVGGLLMMACASFALLGFPLDDVWHRAFGQDVTLWGPTHLMMLTGAAMTLVAIMVLLTEGRRARGPRARDAGAGVTAPRGWPVVASSRVRLVFACGGLLIALSIYQGEFDFGVPQFRLLFHPLLIALAASVALVAARLLAGPGAALGAAAFFVVVRGVLTLVVWGAFDRSVSHFPLFLAEALLVEAIALRMGTGRPYRFALASGAAIGTVGVLAEWGWSHVWMPISWPAHVVPEAIAVALPVALAGATLAAFMAGALRPVASGSGGRRPILAAAASIAVLVAAIAYLLPTTVPEGAGATVTLTDARPAPERSVHATVRVEPPQAARDADWLVGLAWQGKDRLVMEPLRSLGDGVYRTTAPLPVHGSWKSAIRLHRGGAMASIRVFAPRDAAIPAPEVPAPPRFTRAFDADRVMLQRERRDDVPPALWHAAGVAVLSTILALLALMGWALRRVGAGSRTEPDPGPGPEPVARRPRPAAAGVA